MASVARGVEGRGGRERWVAGISARRHNELTIKSTLKTHLPNGHRQSKQRRGRAVRCREIREGRAEEKREKRRAEEVGGVETSSGSV